MEVQSVSEIFLNKGELSGDEDGKSIFLRDRFFY